MNLPAIATPGRRPLKPFLLRAVLLLLVLTGGGASHARAQGGCDDDCVGPVAPEIDPSLAAGGLALIGGVVLLVRGRRTS